MCFCLSLLFLPHESICLLPIHGIICPFPTVWFRIVCPLLTVWVGDFGDSITTLPLLRLVTFVFCAFVSACCSPPPSAPTHLLLVSANGVCEEYLSHQFVVCGWLVLCPIIGKVHFPWAPIVPELLLLLMVA